MICLCKNANLCDNSLAEVNLDWNLAKIPEFWQELDYGYHAIVVCKSDVLSSFRTGLQMVWSLDMDILFLRMKSTSTVQAIWRHNTGTCKLSFPGPWFVWWHCWLMLYPGIRNSIINISFDLWLWFHTTSHDYLPVLSVLVQLWTPDIRSPRPVITYHFTLTAIMSPQTLHCLALTFVYSELRNSRTLPHYLVYKL